MNWDDKQKKEKENEKMISFYTFNYKLKFGIQEEYSCMHDPAAQQYYQFFSFYIKFIIFRSYEGVDVNVGVAEYPRNTQ